MKKIIMILIVLTFTATTITVGNAKELKISLDTKPVFTLQLLDDWTSEIEGAKTTIRPGRFETHIQIWNVSNANTVQDAIPLVPDMIKSEVTDFKNSDVKDISIADSTGKHIIGSGTEADDGDPSNAEIFLFSCGGKIFLLCAHGEGNGAATARSTILKMLDTMKKF